MDLLHELFHFRNNSHLLWFIISMGILLFSIISHYLKRHNGDWWFLYLLGMGFHIGSSVDVISNVIIRNSPTYAKSIDCCWFNPVMVYVYVSALIIGILMKRLRPAEAKVSA